MGNRFLKCRFGSANGESERLRLHLLEAEIGELPHVFADSEVTNFLQARPNNGTKFWFVQLNVSPSRDGDALTAIKVELGMRIYKNKYHGSSKGTYVHLIPMMVSLSEGQPPEITKIEPMVYLSEINGDGTPEIPNFISGINAESLYRDLAMASTRLSKDATFMSDLPFDVRSALISAFDRFIKLDQAHRFSQISPTLKSAQSQPIGRDMAE